MYRFNREFRFWLRFTPLEIADFSYRPLREAIKQVAEDKPFDFAEIAYWCLGPYASVLRGICPVILLEQCTLRGTMQREARLHSTPLRRRVRHWFYAHTPMSQYEARICQLFSWVLFISAEDLKIVRQSGGVSERACVVPVPYCIEPVDSIAEKPKPNSLVFVGGMHTSYNVESLRYFCRDVLPLIVRTMPDIFLTVVGTLPAAKIRKELESPCVRFVGFQRDLTQYLRQHSVFVAPVRTGTGIRTKIIEAMAQGMPIVSTSMGIEGLDVSDGEDILLADSAEGFADSTRELLINETLRLKIATGALDRFKRTYSYEAVSEKTRGAYEMVFDHLRNRS